MGLPPFRCTFEITTNQNTMTKVSEFIAQNSLPTERFLPVTNFEGRFWVSDYGRLVSHDHRKNTIAFLRPAVDGPGYYHTSLRMKPLNLSIRVHQIVGEHFCNKIQLPGKVMGWNHKDGNKLNNYYLNLEYILLSENVAHAIRTGLMDFKGEKHHNVKLTEEMVLQMRELRKTGMIYKDIGKIFGVGRRHAADVVNGICWGWLT